jgi:hypothetical protein
MLQIRNTHATTAYEIGLRKNGSTDNIHRDLGKVTHSVFLCGVDTSRIIEMYVESGGTSISAELIGYFGEEAVFFDNSVDKSLGSTGAWTDIDISSDTGADTATAAFFIMEHGSTSYTVFMRKKGSTDNFIRTCDAYRHYLVGVDGSEVCQGYISNLDVDFHLIGYMTKDVDMETNLVDDQITPTGAWTDLSSTRTGTFGVLYETVTEGEGGSTGKYGLRTDGSSHDVYDDVMSRQGFSIVAPSVSGKVEGQISQILIDFKYSGKFTAEADLGNEIPVISNLAGDTLAYTEGDGAQIIDQAPAATVADSDSADFDTGTLTVSFEAGSTAGEDELGIRNEGTGAGEIGVSGSNVTYGGVTIGTFTGGGSGGSSLVVTFNSSSDTTSASALLQNITYKNSNTLDPDETNRTVRFVITDGDGGTSANNDTTVTVTGTPEPPPVSRRKSKVSQAHSWWKGW